MVLISVSLRVDTEVDGSASIDAAAARVFDHYLYHGRDLAAGYRPIDRLLATDRPPMVAAPGDDSRRSAVKPSPGRARRGLVELR
jgi:hypothetical protein